MRCLADFKYGQVGDADGTSRAGVDYPGVTFLIGKPFERSVTVFGFKAAYRNLNPIRFQIWRPTQSTTAPNNSYHLVAEVDHKPALIENQLPELERVSTINSRAGNNMSLPVTGHNPPRS